MRGSELRTKTAPQWSRQSNASIRGMAWASVASNAHLSAPNLGADLVRLPTESLNDLQASELTIATHPEGEHYGSGVPN